MLESYRPLIRLWAGILSLSAVGVATLQILGPPAMRELRPGGTQAVAPPAVAPPALPQADQPVAAASLPSPAAVEQPAPAFPALALPPQPNRRRAHSWARKGVSLARVPSGQDIGYDGALADRGQSGLQSGLLPQDRDAPPPPAASSPPSRSLAYQHVAGYIGVFTTGADGARVFRATP